MRKSLLCTLLAGALVCCGTALYAQMQDGMGQGGNPGMAQHHMPMSPDQRLEHLTRQLNLTDDQQQKIKPILAQESEQMSTMHSDTSMSQQDKMSKMQQIRQSTSEQIMPILTTEQQKKYQMMESRHMSPHSEGGMGQPAPQSPPPPQQ